MRYLKTFEGFELPGNSEDYYSVIGEIMYNRLTNKLDIDPKIEDLITKEGLIGDTTIYIKDESVYYPYKSGIKRLSIDQMLKISGQMPKSEEHLDLERFANIDVYELQDEWFAVMCIIAYRPKSHWNVPSNTTKFYKCDQVGGLLKLLKDIRIIK